MRISASLTVEWRETPTQVKVKTKLTDYRFDFYLSCMIKILCLCIIINYYKTIV